MTTKQIEKALLALSPAERLSIFKRVVLRGTIAPSGVTPNGTRTYIEWKTVKRNGKEYGPYAYEVTESYQDGKRQRKRKYVGKQVPVATYDTSGRIGAQIDAFDQQLMDAIENDLANFEGVQRGRQLIIEHRA